MFAQRPPANKAGVKDTESDLRSFREAPSTSSFIVVIQFIGELGHLYLWEGEQTERAVGGAASFSFYCIAVIAPEWWKHASTHAITKMHTVHLFFGLSFDRSLARSQITFIDRWLLSFITTGVNVPPLSNGPFFKHKSLIFVQRRSSGLSGPSVLALVTECVDHHHLVFYFTAKLWVCPWYYRQRNKWLYARIHCHRDSISNARPRRLFVLWSVLWAFKTSAIAPGAAESK